MDPTQENIKATKDGVKKLFSQKQLDSIGQGPDGTYDGWTLTAPLPEGIPATGKAATTSDAPKENEEIVSKGKSTPAADKSAADKSETVTKNATKDGKK